MYLFAFRIDVYLKTITLFAFRGSPRTQLMPHPFTRCLYTEGERHNSVLKIIRVNCAMVKLWKGIEDERGIALYSTIQRQHHCKCFGKCFLNFTHAHTHIYTHIPAHVHTHLCTHICAYAHLHMCTHICAHTQVHTHKCILFGVLASVPTHSCLLSSPPLRPRLTLTRGGP